MTRPFTITPALLATKRDQGFSAGLQAGEAAWLKSPFVMPAARLGFMASRVAELEFQCRLFPSEVSVDLQARAAPTRQGILDGLRGGIFGVKEERHPDVAAFVINRSYSVVRDCQWFDFGETDGSFGADWRPFAERGLISLPWPQTCFRALIRRPTGNMETVWIAEQFDNADGPLMVLGLFVDVNIGSTVRGALSFADFMHIHKAELAAHALVKNSLVHLFMSLWLVLNTKGVPKHVVEPNVKLNKARARSGKLPLKPYTKVDTVTYINALRETERLEAGGGHHASPRPHLRRAHLRHLQSGVVVPVAASIVNGSASLKLIQREKYIVKSTA